MQSIKEANKQVNKQAKQIRKHTTAVNLPKIVLCDSFESASQPTCHHFTTELSVSFFLHHSKTPGYLNKR